MNEGDPENRQPVGWVGLGPRGPSDFIPSMTGRKSSGGFSERSWRELTEVIRYHSGGHVKRRSRGLGDKRGIQVIRREGTLQWRRGDLD